MVAWNISSIDEDVCKWTKDKLGTELVGADACLQQYASRGCGLSTDARTLFLLWEAATSGSGQWSVKTIGELTYGQLLNTIDQAIEHFTDVFLVAFLQKLDTWRKDSSRAFPDDELVSLHGTDQVRSILWDESNGFAAQLAAGQVNSCCFVEGVDASGVLLQAPSVLVLYVGPSVVRYSGDSLGTEVEKLAGSSVSFDELKVGVASHVQLKVGEVSRSPASNSTGGGAGGGSSGGSGGSPPPAVLGVAFAPVSAPSQVQVPVRVVAPVRLARDRQANRHRIYHQRLSAHTSSKSVWSSLSRPMLGQIDVSERYGAVKYRLSRAKRDRDGALNDLKRAEKAMKKSETDLSKAVTAFNAVTYECDAITADSIRARDELRRMIVRPHPSRWNPSQGSSTEVVNVRD